jgi:GMP synthase-like glutamine amidotransferase
MHSETFEIPHGAQLLRTGTEVKNQAFRLMSALALQFHPEMTDALIADWTRGLKKSVHTKILKDSKNYLIPSNSLCRHIVRDFFSAGNTYYTR